MPEDGLRLEGSGWHVCRWKALAAAGMCAGGKRCQVGGPKQQPLHTSMHALSQCVVAIHVRSEVQSLRRTDHVT